MTSTSWEVPEDENLDSWLERDDTWRYLRECDENRLIRLLDIMIGNLHDREHKRHPLLQEFEDERTNHDPSRDTLQYWACLADIAVRFRLEAPESSDIHALCLITVVRSIHCALRDLILRLDMLYYFTKTAPVDDTVLRAKDNFSKALKHLDTILEEEEVTDEGNITRRKFDKFFGDGIFWEVSEEEMQKKPVREMLTTWKKLEKIMPSQLLHAWWS